MVYDNLSENDSSPRQCSLASLQSLRWWYPPSWGCAKTPNEADRMIEVCCPLLERSHREVPVQRFGNFALSFMLITQLSFLLRFRCIQGWWCSTSDSGEMRDICHQQGNVGTGQEREDQPNSHDIMKVGRSDQCGGQCQRDSTDRRHEIFVA